jgi:hypothetical protein
MSMSEPTTAVRSYSSGSDRVVIWSAASLPHGVFGLLSPQPVDPDPINVQVRQSESKSITATREPTPTRQQDGSS